MMRINGDTLAGTTVNAEGCATSQIDSDGDGVTNDKDQCPDTPENTDVNEEGCPYLFLAENGVTIKAAPFASAEETYEIGGKTIYL